MKRPSMLCLCVLFDGFERMTLAVGRMESLVIFPLRWLSVKASGMRLLEDGNSLLFRLRSSS